MKHKLDAVTLVAMAIAGAGVAFISPPAVTASPSAESTILDNLMLPSGSRLVGSQAVPEASGVTELWDVPVPFATTVAFLRRQLPLNGPLLGASWCGQFTDPTDDFVRWVWSGNGLLLTVIVYNDGGSFPRGSSVSVDANNDNSGCGGSSGTAQSKPPMAMPTIPTPASAGVPSAGPIGSFHPSDGYLPSYTCNYDVLCNSAGKVIEGPQTGVRLGNGQICAGFGCTRP